MKETSARPSRHDRKLGAMVYRQIKKEVSFEEEPFFLDCIARVSARLHSAAPDYSELKTVIPWMSERTAFTAPGDYIYFTRGLLERCPKDEHVAFVIGHEMAHHHLGHVALFEGWMGKVAELPGADLVPLVFSVMERRVYGPERECDADTYSINLCCKAGYTPQTCLELFDIMENLALDAGDIDIAHGPDDESDDELLPDADWKTKSRIWWWQRTRGYLPLRDRRKRLVTHLSQRSFPLKKCVIAINQRCAF